MEPKELYVITRSEEHADYVEKVFTNECKAIAYCLQFKADENRYQRDITTVKLTEDNCPITITEDMLKGIGFIDVGEENDCKIYQYNEQRQHKYFWYIPMTGVCGGGRIFANNNGEETSEETFSCRCIYNLNELVCAMKMSGINVKQLLKP